MRIKPGISIKSKITNVVVIVHLDFVYLSVDEAGIEKRKQLSEKDFKYKRKFKLNIPLHINYDGFMYDQLNTINAILVRGLNSIVGDAKKEARKQNVSSFDLIEFNIVDIYADKDSQNSDNEVLAEWSPES